MNLKKLIKIYTAEKNLKLTGSNDKIALLPFKQFPVNLKVCKV